ncbi:MULTISPECIES: hypothetical protein [Providencia]|uniref:hypothetical protein n=1 Tax=Providencia TaxID=586 RepID=UPI001E48F43A|nr:MULTISPECIES: hypothetical protein [Providencia]MDN7225074.1 hypothetical protein [Providencia stuartii]MDQ5990420.1 hypothetical protein [Providencia stuartii]WAZ77269.1 hypothetical protein O4001_13505 [Providencia stuartii]WAZ81584.1 hypothetical protein O4002_14520 [Providencia stuartii]
MSGTSKLDDASGENKARFLVDSKGHILDLDYFRNLKFDGQVISRNKLPTMGEPGTYSKTTGGHVIVFDPDGRRMANISKERIKKYLMK